MDNQSYSANPGYAAQPVGGGAYQPAPAQPAQPDPIPTANLPKPPAPRKRKSNFMLLVIAIVSSLVAVTFIGLFIWMWMQWDYSQSNINGKIEEATALAVNANTSAMEAEFAQREKSPYATFTAPEDYGSLEFEYPRTWSSYVSNDASDGEAYSVIFNPGSVVAGSSTYALHLTVENQSYDSAIALYTALVDSGKYAHSTKVINGVTANIYTGDSAIVIAIKIRDKVAFLWTDSLAYSDDFYRIIDSIKYNI